MEEGELAVKKRRKEPQRKLQGKERSATVALYGPDDKTATKLVVGVFRGKKLIELRRWASPDIEHNERIKQEMVEFMKAHSVTSAIATAGPIGCVHEEGIDYPTGEDCPFCPFWRGKQGSRAKDDHQRFHTRPWQV